MTTEQKAKAYDEAIGRANELIYISDKSSLQRKTVEHVFPELKESKDERIRKEMIFYFQEEIPQCSIQEHADKMKEFIAWLEKLTWSEEDTEKKEMKKIEQKNVIDIPLSAKDSELQEVSYHIPEGFHAEIEGSNVIIKKGEQVDWSEEDENRINHLIAYFEDKEPFTAEDDIVYANWLKSLKDRYTWKPSDEQMDALLVKIPIENSCNKVDNILKSLYSDLKKLK